MMSAVDIMNNAEMVLDTAESMVGVSEVHDIVSEETGNKGAGNVPLVVYPCTQRNDGVHDIVSEDTGNKGAGDIPLMVYPCTQCNDGERAILSSYMSLMRQCIELAEKVGAAKA